MHSSEMLGKLMLFYMSCMCAKSKLNPHGSLFSPWILFRIISFFRTLFYEYVHLLYIWLFCSLSNSYVVLNTKTILSAFPFTTLNWNFRYFLKVKLDMGKDKDRSRGLGKVFGHADGVDMVLMVAGFVGSIGDGLAFPAMLIVMSRFMNNVGSTISDDDSNGPQILIHNLNKVWCLHHIYDV